MLVVRHRSKFYEPDDYQAHADEQYSFVKEDANFAPHVVLSWMLHGLAVYRERGFTGVPASMSEWKREFVRNHDEVAEWVADHIVEGEADDHLTQISIARQFKTTNRCKLKTAEFNDRLREALVGVQYAEPDTDPSLARPPVRGIGGTKLQTAHLCARGTRHALSRG